ncbi:MAG: sensor domain-containing diguanylate cyclase, partial [Oleiphilaceae bacterium]|nr:sensor domain-containing diguanylate cyclase [Oleiphilaceae bacterium]
TRVHQVIAELLPAENFFLALYDAATDQLSFPYHVDQYDQPPSPGAPESGCLSAEVIRSGKALLLTPDTVSQRLAELGSGVGQPAPHWLGVPLMTATGTIGALVVQSYSGTVRYTGQDRELLQFVSSQVAAAVERKRTHSHLEYLAQHDQLTGLANRALFLDRLQNSLKKARRESTRLAVLYLDMDKFKQINDSFGHTTGDWLLREVARRLGQCVRESDTVGRLGGDEFAVLLDTISVKKDATVVARKILAALSEPYVLEGQTLITAPSVGIAVYPEHGQDDLQLIRHADDAMYMAKRDGGKRYHLSGAQSE